MRVVVGGGVVKGSSLLTIGLNNFLVSVIHLSSQQKFSWGWDVSRLIKVCRSLTRFLFGVGSSLLKQINLSHLYIYLYYGICQGEISEYIPIFPPSAHLFIEKFAPSLTNFRIGCGVLLFGTDPVCQLEFGQASKCTRRERQSE